MKMVDLYTIKALDYKTAKEALANLPKEAAAVFEQMIRDHMKVVELSEKLSQVHEAIEGTLFDPDFSAGTIDLEESSSKPSESGGDAFSEPPCDLESPGEGKKKSGKAGRRGRHEPRIDSTHLHELPPFSCMCCGENMVRSRSISKTVILAKPILIAQKHVIEARRCLSCQAYEYAQPQEDFSKNIGRYHPSAVAALCALRYLFGVPSLRLETLCGTMGLRVPDSTQWAFSEEAASRIRSWHVFLQKTVANAPVKHFDDTGVNILAITQEVKRKQAEALGLGKNPDEVRSGLHTSVVSSVLPQGKICLFNSGLHHCGEVVARLLEKRTTAETLILMADASSANTSRLPKNSEFEIVVAKCNSHAVRKFKETAESFPESSDFFLQAYARIFKNDAQCHTNSFSPAQRLEYHQAFSKPLLDAMKERAESDFEKCLVEPNSTLGKTYRYFLNHFPELCAFCERENAPICNNLAERMLKTFIRQRKNGSVANTVTRPDLVRASEGGRSP